MWQSAARCCFYHRAACSPLISLSAWLPVESVCVSFPQILCVYSAAKWNDSVPRSNSAWSQRHHAPRQRQQLQTAAQRWQDYAAPPEDADGGRASGQQEHPDSIESDRKRAQREKAVRKATNSAAGMVGRRPHSERELRQKLADREHEPEAIDAAVERIQELGMQSNRDFAELFAQSKWRQSRWAPSRIRRELASKGLAAADIEAGLRETFGDDMRVSLPDPGDEDGDELTADTRFDPRHHLLEGARRQADLSRGLPHETRKRRLIMWLQRRGHSWDIISQLLEQVDLS